jgi:hypothetical protein
MRYLPLAIALAMVAAPAAGDAAAQASGQPEYYGPIDVSDLPQPELVFTYPVIIERPRSRAAIEPIFLHVPVDYAKKWRKYCYLYDACKRPVYFVREKWYREVYVPRRGRLQPPKDQSEDFHFNGSR